MSTQEVLRIVKDRGLSINLKDGQPLLCRPQGSVAVTDSLLSVLKIHRQRIIDILKATPKEPNT
jgi:hypothetical protein